MRKNYTCPPYVSNLTSLKIMPLVRWHSIEILQSEKYKFMKLDRFTLSISFLVATWRRALARGLECRSSKACATIWHWIAVRERRGGGSSEAVKGCVRFRSRFQQRFIHQISFDWNLGNAMEEQRKKEPYRGNTLHSSCDERACLA